MLRPTEFAALGEESEISELSRGHKRTLKGGTVDEGGHCGDREYCGNRGGNGYREYDGDRERNGYRENSEGIG
jgi:hypothetical protein